MSYTAQELNTKIALSRQETTRDSEGYPVTTWTQYAPN